MVSTVELSAYFEQQINAENTFYYFHHAKDIHHPMYVRVNTDGSQEIVEKQENDDYKWISSLAKGEGHWYLECLIEKYHQTSIDSPETFMD